MPPLVTAILQTAAFSFVVFQLGSGISRWLLRPRETVLRRHQRFWNDPVRSIERQLVRTWLLAVAALAAWGWARLPWLWLGIAVVCGALGVSGFVKFGQFRDTPSTHAQRKPEYTEADIARLATRGRLAGALGSGVLLALWLYSWHGVLRDLWASLPGG